MSFLMLILIGILIGTGVVIPGVSGGVLAVIFNVYDKIIYSINNIYRSFKTSIKFLFPIMIGIIFGIIWFSKILLFLYNRYEVITKLTFIGLILGGIPYLFKEVKKHTSKDVNILISLLVFILSLIIFYISRNYINISNNYNNKLIMFVAGLLYSSGKIIPGISGSFILILLGLYEYILMIISNPLLININILPFIIGFIIGVFIFIKIINYFLKYHYQLTYSIIIGFVLGSIPSIIPSLTINNNLLIGIVFMIISFILSYKLTKS